MVDYVNHGAQEAIAVTAAVSASATFAPAPGQIVEETDTGKRKCGDGKTPLNALAYLPGGGAVASVNAQTGDVILAPTDVGSLPIADPTGVTITTWPNGFTGVGTANVLTFPGDTPVFIFKQDGDAFPRMIIPSDPGDGIYMGDGTFDPYLTPKAVLYAVIGDGTLPRIGFNHTNVGINDGDLYFDAAGRGPIIPDTSDGHTYRIISTAGALSTEQVT